MLTILFCTTPFEVMARVEAAGLGLPDLPLAIVPHPLLTRTREELKSIAALLVSDVAEAATNGA